MAIISNKDAATAHAPLGSSTNAAWHTEKVTPFLRGTDRALALRRVAPPVETTPAASLPMLASAGDIREVVRLLKKRSGGITIIEGMDAIRRVFDPRKVAAYEYWGLIVRTGDRLRLSALGWEFARKLEPEAQLYRTMLSATLAYSSALRWVFEQQLEIVTDTDVAAFWFEHPAEAALTGSQKTIEGNVVCFFHLCQEAELGMATVGKRGQHTRLRVDREELAAYIAASSSTPKTDVPAESALEDSAHEQPAMTAHAPHPQLPTAQPSGKLRVLISQSREAELIKQIQMALEVAGIESEMSLRAESSAELVPDELFQAMRRCDAAIIIVTDEDCRTDAEGSALLNESVMMEIAAAIVHYNRRVILLWNERTPVPARLRDLCRCELAGHSLTWEAGMQLLKALRDFKS